MPTYTVTSVEKLREKDTNYGKKKVIKLGLQNAEGQEAEAEWFTSIKSQEPTVGETIEGEVTKGNYGLEFKKPRGGGSSGGYNRRSPEETKRIVDQHSQGVAAQREANLIAAGHRPLTDEQWHNLVAWLTAEVYGKQKDGVIGGLLQSDVPVDDKDLVP